MSYILEALRKAEQQRLKTRPQTIYNTMDLRQTERTSTRQFYGMLLVGGLLTVLAINVLLFGFWRYYVQGREESSSQRAVQSEDISSPAVRISEQPLAPPVSRPAKTPADDLQDLPALLTDLPESEQRKIPELSLRGHVHARNDPTKSFIILNDQVLREGDKSEQNIEVIKIYSDNIVLRFGAIEFYLDNKR